jgi:hypothetical protein
MTLPRTISALSIATTLFAVACTETHVKKYEDQARLVCLAGSPDVEFWEGSFVLEDEEAWVRVVITDCASYCADLVYAECDAEREGNSIHVTSRARLETTLTRRGSACPTACQVVQAYCPVGPLETGTYVISHGGETREITVPSYEACQP